jgi:hypothetical protein
MPHRIPISISLLLALCWLVPTSSQARPPKPEELPPALRDWQKWVLQDQGEQVCPFLQGGGSKVCVWFSRLNLVLDEKRGTFSQSLRAYREEWVPLPGDGRRWPQSVKLDGKDAVVTPRGDRPMVRVTPGEHIVTGEFLWDALPEALDLPPETALLSLTVRGKNVALPNRSPEGRVFLQKETVTEETENLEVTVSRRLIDEIPFQLTTHIELNVSGKSREVLLGRALPDGFVPMALNSSLPARIEADGRLRLQVRPGTWTVDLDAHHDDPVTKLSRPKPDGTWTTEDEIWVFDARPSLRQVLVEGVDAVDPTQTRLPSEWKHLPAYAVGADVAVQLTERRRGDSDPPPDLLTLNRQFWLDFDGRGMTVSDQISGQLHRSWRLDMQPRTELGRVVASGADQSITRLGAGKAAGVELRQGNLSLEADSRIQGDVTEVPAVSWDADFHQVSSTLSLPPGWRLFHATGADEVRETWVHAWTLLDIFLVLIIALAVGRLFGVPWGALALVTLTLSFNEEGAPRYAWLAVLVGEALVRVLPDNWVKTTLKLYRLAAWASLVIITVSFMVDHVRFGMYPALEQHRQLGGVQSYSDYSSANAATYARSWGSASGGESFAGSSNGYRPMAQTIVMDGELKEEAAKDQITIEKNAEAGNTNNAPAMIAGKHDTTITKIPQQAAQAQGRMQLNNMAQKQRSFNVLDYDKNAMVQTGPGLPRWEWTRVTFGFSGPVERSQTLQLYLVPPEVNLVLAFVRVVLLGLLVLCLLGFPGKFWPGFLRKGRRGAASAAATVVLLGLALFGSEARAENASTANGVPSQEILDQLRQRLLEPPECSPTCASSPRMFLEVTPSALKIRMEVLAGVETAVPLPGSAQHWVPEQVLLDNKPAPALMRDSEGTLWLAITEGAHQVLLEGNLPKRETVQLALPLKPKRVEAKLEGWRLDGLHEDGLADDNLQLSHQEQAGDESVALQTGTLPPLVRVERTLVLGLQWTVETHVERLSPTGSAVVLEVPLLPGESVTTVDVRVQNGRALVNMSPNATDASWTSVLAEKSPIELKAPKGLPWVEVWRLDVSPIWHIQPNGIPVVHQQDDSGARLPEWRPWPGESVSVEVVKPDSVPGQTFTIDESRLHVSPGVRATDASLTFNLRSSRGGLHTLELPSDAQLQNVIINGQQQPIRQDGAKVSIPLLPGSQSVQLSWRQTSGITGWYKTPLVSLGTPSVNADLDLQVPQDRWVLFVGGPRMGPAVLFWSFFLVLLLVAVGLSRIPWTPLRTHHWLLLALGLSQVPIPAAAVVFGWLLLLGWREKRDDVHSVALFDLRQLLIVGTTIAAMIILIGSIYDGLLGRPEMQISGNGSGDFAMHWFQDRTTDHVPQGWVVSVPMLVYRGAMLAWSLWLALALLRWLKWAWTSFTTGGAWKSSPPRPKPPTPPVSPTTATAASNPVANKPAT